MRQLTLLAAAVLACQAQATIPERHIVVRNGRTNAYFEAWVPMRDGVKLYTYGAYPEPGKKVTIELSRNCYVPSNVRPNVTNVASACRNDRIYIVQHCRGCGMSEGDFIPYVHEHDDGLALLDWVRQLPFYNGSIYLVGGSYLSSVHLCYLSENPSDVKGCVLKIQDCCRYNILFRNGLYKKGLNGSWYEKVYKKKSVLPSADTNVTFETLPFKDFAIKRFGEHPAAFEEDLRHPDPRDPYWQTIPGGSQAAGAVTQSTMPILLTTGWYDIYTEGIFDMWRSMSPARRAKCALICGAYDHGGRFRPPHTPYWFPDDASRVSREPSLQDWERFCETGVALPNAAPGKITYYALWENKWYVEPEFKDGPVTRTLFPNANGTLGEKAAAGTVAFTYDPDHCPEFPGGGPFAFDGMQEQPAPNFRADVLSFVSQPFNETIDVRGRMRVNLMVSSDCDDTCFYVRTMIRKHDTGKWYNLRDEITGLLFAVPTFKAGAQVPLNLLLSDHAFRVEPGDRLRLDVAGGNGKYYVRHTNYAGPYYEQTRTRKARNSLTLDSCRWQIPTLPPARR